MDRLFEPDRVVIRDKRSIILLWVMGAALLLLAIWIGMALRLQHDLHQLRQQAQRTSLERAQVYAQQLQRTVKEIDQISLTVQYQWQNLKMPLDLADQYEKAMHHTPTYPVAIGADGRVISSWRRASVGLDMSGMDFFIWHRAHPDTGLRINPPAVGIGGMAGKRTIRFTRRVNDDRGRFVGVVMVSTEPSYLASLGNDDVLKDGDFVQVRLMSGPSLVVKTRTDVNAPLADFIVPPAFPAVYGVRDEPGAQFADERGRIVGWRQLEDYPLVAIAATTEASAVAAYAPTRSAYLEFATVTSLIVLLVSGLAAAAQVRNAERRRKAEQVRSTFRMAVDGAREAFYMISPVRGPDGEIIDWLLEDCNERAADMQRKHREQLIGSTFSQLFPNHTLQHVLAFFGAAFEQHFKEDEFRVHDGEVHRPGWFQRRAVRSGDGIAITVRDITDARRHEETLAQLAVTDTLTGLPNRRWLNDYLPGALTRARAARKRVALLFIDLDNFKKVNDTLGHAAGDELLRAAAACLKAAVRATDPVVRLGGDEFTVLLENLERDDDATPVAEQVIRAFSESAVFAPWAALNVRCSVGVAVYPSHAQDVDELLRHADAAMYAAKTAGKGCYRVYQMTRKAALTPEGDERRKLELP